MNEQSLIILQHLLLCLKMVVLYLYKAECEKHSCYKTDKEMSYSNRKLIKM